jgi:SET domain-containing protein
MPLVFEFKGNPQQPDEVTFRCPLACTQCTRTTAAGTRCKNRACIGVPMCWQHLRSERYLRVKESTISGAGKGAFVDKPRQRAGEPVFANGSRVIEYDGELVTKAQTSARYGESDDNTAPYTAGVDWRYDEDASCRRGVGSIINHNQAQPNVELLVEGVAGRRSQKVVLVATRDIYNGEELFVNYGTAFRMPRQIPGRPGYHQYTTAQRRLA